MSIQPKLQQIKNGWAAIGQGWAVHAPTQEEALRKFEEAERKHQEIAARPPKTQDGESAQF